MAKLELCYVSYLKFDRYWRLQLCHWSGKLRFMLCFIFEIRLILKGPIIPLKCQSCSCFMFHILNSTDIEGSIYAIGMAKLGLCYVSYLKFVWHWRLLLCHCNGIIGGVICFIFKGAVSQARDRDRGTALLATVQTHVLCSCNLYRYR